MLKTDNKILSLKSMGEFFLGQKFVIPVAHKSISDSQQAFPGHTLLLRFAVGETMLLRFTVEKLCYYALL